MAQYKHAISNKMYAPKRVGFRPQAHTELRKLPDGAISIVRSDGQNERSSLTLFPAQIVALQQLLNEPQRLVATC